MPTELRSQAAVRGLICPSLNGSMLGWRSCELNDLDNDAEVAVRICGAEESCSLNSRYRGIKKADQCSKFPSGNYAPQLCSILF